MGVHRCGDGGALRSGGWAIAAGRMGQGRSLLASGGDRAVRRNRGDAGGSGEGGLKGESGEDAPERAGWADGGDVGGNAMSVSLEHISTVVGELAGCRPWLIRANMNVRIVSSDSISQIVMSLVDTAGEHLKCRDDKVTFDVSVISWFIKKFSGEVKLLIRFFLMRLSMTRSLCNSKHICLFGSIASLLLLTENSVYARCTDYPSIDLSQDAVIKEVSDFFPSERMFTHPRYKKPKTNEINVYIASYNNILDSEFGKSVQDEIIKVSNNVSRKTCSLLSISFIKYDLSLTSEGLNISYLLSKESTIIFLISTNQDFNAIHGRSEFGHVYGPPIIESEDRYNSVSVELFRTTLPLNQHLVIMKSSGIPSKRLEDLRLSRPIERIFNLNQGCGWHRAGFCTARDEIWMFMFNKKIFDKDYWRDILSVYHDRAGDRELAR